MNILTPLRRALLCLACCAAVGAGAAERRPSPADPADADAPVPATRYAGKPAYRPAPAAAKRPDQNWQALNRTVGAYNSMALTMGGPPEATPTASQESPAAGRNAAPEHAHHHHGGGR